MNHVGSMKLEGWVSRQQLYIAIGWHRHKYSLCDKHEYLPIFDSYQYKCILEMLHI